jgi:hypothetical protein
MPRREYPLQLLPRQRPSILPPFKLHSLLGKQNFLHTSAVASPRDSNPTYLLGQIPRVRNLRHIRQNEETAQRNRERNDPIDYKQPRISA